MLVRPYLLAWPYRHFDGFANLPFVNIRDSKFVVEVIRHGEIDLGLLRFIDYAAIN